MLQSVEIAEVQTQTRVDGMALDPSDPGRADEQAPYAAGMQTIELAGAAGPLVCDVWRARQPSGKTPVVLVHGWGGSGMYWRATAEHLAATVDVIVPDLPGSGRSMPVSRALNLADLTQALQQLLMALDVPRVQLVGHSMGAAVSILLADAAPARVERLALVSMSFFTSWVQHQIYSAVMSAFSVGMIYRPHWLARVPYVPQMVAMRYFYRVPDDPALLRRGMLDFLTMDRATAVTCANDASSEAIPVAGARVDVPTLLIASRQDLVMPVSNVEYTVQTIPNCRVRWIEECGHLPMVEKSQEFMEILDEFLDV